MAFEIHLVSPAPPERVLAAIKDNTREWRESVIPAPLWRKGVLQVVGEIKPPRFRLRYDRRWYQNEGGDPLELTGTVVAHEGGGCMVTARCGARGVAYTLAAFLAVLLAWDYAASGAISWFLVLIGVAFIAFAIVSDRRVSRQSPEAAYLEARLREAVETASRAVEVRARPV